MPVFGGRSITALKTVHPQLARVLTLAVASFDFMVIQSNRTQEEQEADYKKGVTRAHWLQSPHDFNPSFAVDCAPVPLDWSNTHSFFAMSVAVKSASRQLDIPVSWGGDFHSIKDMPHFELTNWRDLAQHLGNKSDARIS